MAQRFAKQRGKEFIELAQIKTVGDTRSALKERFGQTLQAMLAGQMDPPLG